VEAQIAALAERQHGLVTLPQLQSLGLGKSGVSRRAQSGRLHRIHRGVYVVGRPHLTQRGHWMAAVLAYGSEARLSHRSSAGLHGLRPDNRPKIDVTLRGPCARPRPGIDAHASVTLDDADLTTVAAIPCTTVARTLVDLGDVVNREAVQRAVKEAEILRTFDLAAVNDALERAGPRKGAGVLRAILTSYTDPGETRSRIERRVLALCRRERLDRPEPNAWITLENGISYQADFLWRKHRLIAETDGRETHMTAAAFEHDRLRDQRLAMAGYTVVRFTWRQVVDDPAGVAGTLRTLLARLARP
jgi:very-short-patch-repair endonuclease